MTSDVLPGKGASDSENFEYRDVSESSETVPDILPEDGGKEVQEQSVTPVEEETANPRESSAQQSGSHKFGDKVRKLWTAWAPHFVASTSSDRTQSLHASVEKPHTNDVSNDVGAQDTGPDVDAGSSARDVMQETESTTSRSPVRTRIYFYNFNEPHYGFTNFSPHLVTYKGKVYPTSEHLFQSFKFQDHEPEISEHIRTFSDRPRVALTEARRYAAEVRADWRDVNISKMDEALFYKFKQHPDLMQELLDTGEAELIEDSDKDSFWGIGPDGQGRNELGKALERLRGRLRDDEGRDDEGRINDK